MCGIYAYTGKQQALPILVDGLTSLEYRGYDSAGIYIPTAGAIKSVGAVENLRAKITKDFTGTSGIAHLRWATHGEPTKINAHPHHDCDSKIWVVHNGIVENFQELKAHLSKKGHTFLSETDTEVIAHLIEEHARSEKDFTKAVINALNDIKGTYGLTVASEAHPEMIIAARMGAPVVLGVGDKEYFVASDPSPILKHTKRVLYLQDGEVAVLTPDMYSICTLEQNSVERNLETIEWAVEEIQKNGYEHFMLKEIMEGPEVVKNTLRGRLLLDQGTAKLGGLESVQHELKSIKRIIIVGCGTAYYAGLVGEYMLEEYAGIPVEVEVGSEFRYRHPHIEPGTVLIAVSQSGETADTLEAIREAKRQGALTLGIVNTVGSTIARETDAGVYNHAGPEIGVASTKAFISQLTALILLTLYIGRMRTMSLEQGMEIVKELQNLPDKIAQILKDHSKLEKLAETYSSHRDFLYVGRKLQFPIALEGALKLKEVSYIHAEGYGAGEMKHGPLAMIDENFPTLAICLDDSVYEKMISNVQEIRARKGRVLAIATEGNQKLATLVQDIFFVPKAHEIVSPILSIVPLQLFAYYIAKAKELNVDRPRNLAKSVTVE
ncbi:MAG: glutamine--fructose-6-phosphate transaminase (isomerizing) [Patescibacteria group bacterium]